MVQAGSGSRFPPLPAKALRKNNFPGCHKKVLAVVKSRIRIEQKFIQLSICTAPEIGAEECWIIHRMSTRLLPTA